MDEELMAKLSAIYTKLEDIERRMGKPASSNLMSVQETASYLGIGMSKMYELVGKSEIPYVLVGKVKRFRKVDLDRYLDRRSEKSTEQLNMLADTYIVKQSFRTNKRKAIR